VRIPIDPGANRTFLDRRAAGPLPHPVAANPYSPLFVQTERQNPDAWKQLGAEVTDVVSPELTGR